MTLIGRRCTGGDAFSRARLIARTLSGGAFAPRLPSGPVPVPLLSAAIVSADNVIEAATARRLHPFPFRTGQLSSGAPMVLRKRESRSPPSSSPSPFSVPFTRRGTGRGKGFFFSCKCRNFSFLSLLAFFFPFFPPFAFLRLLFPSRPRFRLCRPRGVPKAEADNEAARREETILLDICALKVQSEFV